MLSRTESATTVDTAQVRLLTRRNMLRIGCAAAAAASLGLRPLQAEQEPSRGAIQAVDFGPDYAVLGTSQKGRWTYVRLGYREHSFVLRSTDGRTWRTD